MKKVITLDAVNQTGHNCKITAIAMVEKYFAAQIGFTPMPLHKKKRALLSLRQLAKSKGSVQGELLEIRQWSELLNDLGYATECVDVRQDIACFEQTVTHQLAKGNLVIACFSVNRDTGQPTTQYNGWNEHAALLHGFDTTSQQLDLTHWGKQRKTSVRDFYQSLMSLPSQRQPEYYRNIKQTNQQKKYELVSPASADKRSIVPVPESGFRGKLLVIKQPLLAAILTAREQLVFKHHQTIIQQQLKQIKIKINQLIHKSSHDRNYKAVAKIAFTLNQQLETASEHYVTQKKITFEEFKQRCQTAIKAAEPEFAKHRGWHQLNVTLRQFIGILLLLLVYPAIRCALDKHYRQAYANTFFSTPKTDAAEKLGVFVDNINQIPVQSC